MGGPGRVTEVPEALLRRCAFPPEGSPIDVAVSGGADSLALLALACAAGCAVTAHHVDHGQRPESAAEAGVVAAAAARFGAWFSSHRVSVETGPNLEARLRQARWEVLPPGTATGHTADDRAETILLNLMRGSGLDGMVAMLGAYHPILALRRSETHSLCKQLGLEPVVDPSNLDPRFRRNRVRHELLPLLDDIARRDVAEVLARQADLLAGDAALLDELAVAVDPADAAAVRSAPVALARRALRKWIASEIPGGYAPSAAAVERVLEVAAGRVVACEVGQGLSVRRSAGRLRIVKESRLPVEELGGRELDAGEEAAGGHRTGDEPAWA